MKVELSALEDWVVTRLDIRCVGFAGLGITRGEHEFGETGQTSKGGGGGSTPPCGFGSRASLAPHFLTINVNIHFNY